MEPEEDRRKKAELAVSAEALQSSEIETGCKYLSETPASITMAEPLKKAFDFASDATKQLITLSTAIIAFTVTFSKDILRSTPGQNGSGDVAAPVPHSSKILLAVSWGLYLVSIICGIWTLLALTGTLEPLTDRIRQPLTIRGSNVTLPSALQIVCFLLATLLIVAFGIKSVW